MNAKKIEAVIYPVSINGHGFSCTFSIVSSPYHLFITTLGANPFTIDFEIDGFDIPKTLTLPKDIYSKLCKYLNLHYDAKNPFRPIKFLIEINTKTPQQSNDKPVKKSDLVRLTMASHPDMFSDEEAEKPYFCGWKTNSIGRSVRDINFQKTLQYFSREEAEMRRKLNQSSCWSADPSEERLDLLNQLISKIDEV